MSSSVDTEKSKDDSDQDINYDEIEQLISDATEANAEKISNSRPISSVQCISLSLDKSLVTTKENSESPNNQKPKSPAKIAKISNIPGPVGFLPLLKTNEDLRRLKEDKAARDTLLTDEQNVPVKRPKPSSEYFSLNIKNYPSYTTALRQLQELYYCEPIDISNALTKARLGIKKRIPLICAAVTHYDRQENTILLDKTAHIRATFIGDDELLDSFNIRVGHTLLLRNVAVFTSTRHRHHYVNIHLQDIVAIQDPLNDTFTVPKTILLENPQQSTLESILLSIGKQIPAYVDASKSYNETFHIFSQIERDDDDQPPLKKMNANIKPSTSSAFSNIKSNHTVSSSLTSKFKQTIIEKPRPATTVSKPSVLKNQQSSTSDNNSNNKLASTAVKVVPSSSSTEMNLVQMIETPAQIEINPDDFIDKFFEEW